MVRRTNIHPLLQPYAKRAQSCFYFFGIVGAFFMLVPLLLAPDLGIRGILIALPVPLIALIVSVAVPRQTLHWLREATDIMDTSPAHTMLLTTTCHTRTVIGRRDMYELYAQLSSVDGSVILNNIPLMATDQWSDMRVPTVSAAPVTVYYDETNLRRPIVIQTATTVYCMEQRGTFPPEYPKVRSEHPLTIDVYPEWENRVVFNKHVDG